jgi:hypothetical protein
MDRSDVFRADLLFMAEQGVVEVHGGKAETGHTAILQGFSGRSQSAGSVRWRFPKNLTMVQRNETL